jgi:hypothetical protein
MRGDANSALCRIVGIRMVMRKKGKRRPEGQQQTEPRDAFREQPHVSYTLPS